VPYALPRLDKLAVPSTRRVAMEDWGLISYPESALLVNPATTPAQRRWIYELIAHEIAHQWFGNLVSAASWSEIWLSEAFATWMARKATHRFNPDWHTALNTRSAIEQTMALDATEATRAIRSGPVRETAVMDVFDGITYDKGGAVLTMIEQWLGEVTFRRGLAAYMRERRMSGATAGDLWHHIGRASGRDVAAMAASWTDQVGFPLVTLHTRCEGGSTRVELSQRRFVSGQALNTPVRWQVPVRLAHGLRESTVMFAEERAHVTLPGCDAQPVRANAGGLGFYRVAYAPEAHSQLRERFAELPAADRVALLADALAFIREGSMPVSELSRWLTLPATVQDAGRGPLFKQAIDAFEWLDKALAGTPQQAAMRELARSLMAPELARLGWDPKEGDDSETLTLRARLVRQLASLDDAATLAEALARALRDESGAQPLHASMRRPVRVAAGVSADRERFDRLLAELARADNEQERFTLALALASGRDADRARELLDRMLKGDLPSNLALRMPSMVAENSPYGELVYRHLLEHWPKWAEIAGQSDKRWLLPGAAASANDPARAKGLVEDQARLVGPDGALTAARAAAQISQKADLKSRAAILGP
jgi:aminopeptidase N